MVINADLQQKTLLGACALFGLLILFTFMNAISEWHGDWQLIHQQPAPALIASSDETAALINNVPNAHLFGQSFENGNVPITNLQLQVTGIVKVEGDTNASKAYISISGQPSKIYHAGDDLPYGVKVYDITPDAVILENDGHLEKLPLPREKLQFKPRNREESL